MIGPALVLGAALLSQDDPYSLAGPHQVGQTTVAITRSDNSTVNSIIFYPSLASGVDAPIDTSDGPYPAITFAPGFFTSPDWYTSTLSHLASKGYLVIASYSQSGSFSPNKDQYVQDVRDTITYLLDENNRAGSMFQGTIRPDEIGASGHSLGGGVSIVAAALDDRIKALAPMAAATLRTAGPLGDAPPPYADVAVANLPIPVSLINGSQDGYIPVATNGQVIYDAASAPKLLPNLTGGYHFGFIDFEIPFLSDTGSVTQDVNRAFARAELTSFFDLYLKGDQSAWRRQWGPERLALSGIQTQLDPGVTITSDHPVLTGQPGSQAIFHLTIRNTSGFANSFHLFSEDNGWSVDFASDHTPSLAPGGIFETDAFVTIPLLPGLATDQALLSARSDRDNGTRGFTIIVTAVPEASNLLLVAVACVLGSRLRRR